MFPTRYRVLFLILCNALTCRGLEKVAKVEDNTILVTESIIRNTMNRMFLTMNTKGVKSSAKIRQFALTHNFMISVTLRDHKALNTIVRLSRVNENVKNETQNLVNIINDILNEDSIDKEIEPVSHNEDVLQYVDGFLSKLEGFKEHTGYNNSYEKVDINEDVLRILNDISSKSNFTGNSSVDENDYVLYDYDFWVPENQTRRIFKGERVKIKYFPFMASIQMFNSFQCGGSIIKSDLVLTAASCLQLAWNNRFYRENPAFLSVRVGSNFYNGGGENIPVLEVYFHPDYNPKNLRNNICIVRLLRRLKFRKKKRRKVKTIEIDRNDSPLPVTADGITIIGWGATGLSNIVKDPWTNRLTFAVLEVYHLHDCQEVYSREYVSHTNFCAGFISKGGGACNRDVGGPGVVGGVLTGVISFGSPVCGTPDAPTVFTKVGYYADWIDEIMDLEVPYLKKRTTTRLPHSPTYFTTPLPHAAPTTYKIPPLMKNWKPTHIAYQENLRLLEDENLFKDFLKTMFASTEAKDYIDLLNDIAVKKARDADMDEEIGADEDVKNINDFKKGEKFVTKIDDFDEIENVSPKLEETTFTEEPIPFMIQMDKPTQKVLGKLDKTTKKYISEEIGVNIIKEKHKKIKQNVKMPIEKSTMKIPIGKDEVFTLLYISDEENPKIEIIESAIADFDENLGDGLSISLDGFRDLTFRNNNTDSVLNSISKSELYEIFNDAIRDYVN